MKILVTASVVPDIYSVVRPSDDGTGAVVQASSLTVNPADKQTLSKALSVHGAEVTVLSVTGNDAAGALGLARAMGAFRVVRIDACPADAFCAASHTAEFLAKNDFDLVLCGALSWDYATGEFPRWLSHLSGLPLLDGVSDFSAAGDGFSAERKTDKAVQRIMVKGPLILSCGKDIFPENEIRIPSMREMMTAMRIPAEVIRPSVGFKPEKEFYDYSLPLQKPPVKFFEKEEYGRLAEIILSASRGDKMGNAASDAIPVFSGRLYAHVRGADAPEGIAPEFSVVEEISVPAHRNLRDARVVVSGGMGAGLQAWRPIESIACLLDGAVACTRPVYQSGLRGYFEHVGQTGEKIAPRLYIAAGISGALQHVAGIIRSERILAINTDPQAEIFKYADYGVVGDAADVLGALEKILTNMCRKD